MAHETGKRLLDLTAEYADAKANAQIGQGIRSTTRSVDDIAKDYETTLLAFIEGRPGSGGHGIY